MVPITSHEFGIVRQGARVGQTFTVRNVGSASLALDLLQFTQPGMAARFGPEVAAGAEGAIRIEWDTGLVKGPVEGVAIVRVNDPLRPEVRFVLRATVQPPIEFQPFAAIFLSAFRGESVQRRLRLLNHEDRPLRIFGLESSSERFTATVHTVETGTVYELYVTSRPDAPFGRAKESLYLLTDHPERGRLRIPVNVLIKPDVYVNPEAVDFGPVSLAEVAKNPGLLDLLSQTFMVKTRRGEMQIKAIESDLDCLDIRQSPPKGQASAFRIDVGLVLRRLRPGPITGSIRIATSDPRFPELTVPVTIGVGPR